MQVVVSSIALFGAEFLLPLYLQTLRGQTPLQAGLLVLPLALSAGVVTPIAGALYNRIGGRWLIFVGSILLAINTWELAHLTVDTSYTAIMVIVAIRGIALGLVLQTTLTTALYGLKPMQLPRASSLLNASRNVFQSFGIAILGTIVTNQFTTSQQAAVNDIHNPATSLGQQLIQIEQTLIQHGVSSLEAAKAAVGKLLAQIFDPQGPIFQLNFNSALNDAYFVTFWLAVATIFLALTLPGRPKLEKRSENAPEAIEARQVV